MRFRLKFFGLHLLASLVVLTSLLGARDLELADGPRLPP